MCLQEYKMKNNGVMDNQQVMQKPQQNKTNLNKEGNVNKQSDTVSNNIHKFTTTPPLSF